MTPERAATVVAEHLVATFGTVLLANPPERRRRATGATWSVPVILRWSGGDIPIAEVDVDESGAMSPFLAADDLVRAIRIRRDAPSEAAPTSDYSEADHLFSEIAREAGNVDSDVEISSIRLRELFRNTTPESLLESRKLLPHLLTNTHRRGRVLMMMAEVERRLGENQLALGYVEAAAHELADKFDIAALHQLANMAAAIVGESGLSKTAIPALLERCDHRLVPLESLYEAEVLSLIPPEYHSIVDENTLLLSLVPGAALVNEGDPSVAIFVIKSGVLAVLHESPSVRLVRCCSPGWLLGESSVLDVDDPRCTATLRAEHPTEVYRIDASAFRSLMRKIPALQSKMSETKTVHGLDSFFAAHESVGQLDAEVRNQMLRCIQNIRAFEKPTIVMRAGDLPHTACLVARGTLSLYEGTDTSGAPSAVLGRDQIVGVRDALHRLPASRTAVAEPGSAIVFLNGDELRNLANTSPEQAVLVLERLG